MNNGLKAANKSVINIILGISGKNYQPIILFHPLKKIVQFFVGIRILTIIRYFRVFAK